MEWQAIIDQVRGWLAEESISHGAAVAGASGAALLAGLWRLLRRRPTPAQERTVISVNAAKGESISITTGTGHYEE